MSRKTKPIATVLVITYNHEPFIDQAIQSVLNQEGDFDYEILISDDCSTDGTRAIVEEYAKRYPKRIRLLLSAQNLNDNRVLTRGFDVAQGSYVALLDGDDYWTSTTKLQEQVTFLETHPHCSMCFHNVVRLREDRSQPPAYSNPPNQKRFSGILDILDGDFIPTCSAMLRTELIRNLPEWYTRASAGDWALFVLAAEHGPIGYIDRVMGVYRIHARGEWSGLSDVEQVERLIQGQRELNAGLDFRYDSFLRQKRGFLYGNLAALHERAGQRNLGKDYFKRGIESRSIVDVATDSRAWILWLKLYLPTIANLARRVRTVLRGTKATRVAC